MRRSTIAGLTGLALASLVTLDAVADCNDPFAKPEEVLDFQFRMAKADWVKLMASKVTNVDPLPVDSPGCKEQFPEFKAEFRCGADGPWLKIGLRKKKGEERGAEAVEKPPMKIDFNEDFMGMVPEAKGQRWPKSLGDLAFRKLTLNNGQSNKSADGRTSVLPMLHGEHVALRMLAKDVPLAPKSAFAKVTMYFDAATTGEYHGVYILIEDIDRTALRRRGLPGVGRFEKASTANCSPELEFDDGPPNLSKPAFDAFIAKAPGAGWLAEAGKGLDVDVALRQEAIREILINGNDTLFNSVNPPGWGNNFYAFDPREGVRQYIPWDVDLAFGQQFGACMPTPLQCPATVPLLGWCVGPAPPYARTLSRLGLKLSCNEEVKKRYLQIMCQLTNGPLAADEILKEWNQTFETLKAIVPLEKDSQWKGVDPLGPPPTGYVETFGSEYERIKKWIPDRIAFVQKEITRLGVACSAGCTAGATDSCTYLGCASQRRCENGKWTACQANTACLPKVSPPSDGGVPADGGGMSMPGTGGAGAGGTSGGSTGGAPGSSTGGAPGGGGGPSASGGSGGSSSGRGGSSGGTGGSSGASTESDPAPAGCGCDLGRAAPSREGPAALALLGLFGLLARRRSRRG